MVTRISITYPFLSKHVVLFIHAFLYGFSSISQEFQCICSVLNADVSGLNSAASAVPRYTLVRVSDLSDQILRLIFYLNNHCKASGFRLLHSISFLLFFFFSSLRTEIDVYPLVWLFQVFLFANSKCKRYFHNRLKPSKLTWTAMFRKQHKKVEYPSVM